MICRLSCHGGRSHPLYITEADTDEDASIQKWLRMHNVSTSHRHLTDISPTCHFIICFNYHMQSRHLTDMFILRRLDEVTDMLPTFPRHTHKSKKISLWDLHDNDIFYLNYIVMLNRSPENNHQAASPFLPHLLHPSELYHSYSRSVCVASCLQFLLCSGIYLHAPCLNIYARSRNQRTTKKL